MNGAGMNSHNHPAFASVGSWLYRFLGGLRLGGGGSRACGEAEGAFEGGAFARVITIIVTIIIIIIIIISA